MSKPRLALGSALIAMAVAVAGCGTGEVAEKVSGFHLEHFKSVYTAKPFCSDVRDEVSGKKASYNETYVVKCLSRARFLVKMVKACERNEVKPSEYWVSIKSNVVYLDCNELNQLTEGESPAQIREDIRKFRSERP